MSVTGLTPYNLSELLTGSCRVLITSKPGDLIIPNDLLDLQEVEKAAGYAAADGWDDFGGTTDGAAYGNQISTSGFDIDQSKSTVAETVQDVVRTVQVNAAQVSAEKLRILEQAVAVEEVKAEPGRSAEKHVPMGSVEALERYGIAFIGRRVRGQGADVTEPDGTVRGAMVAGVLFSASITGDQRAIQVAKGQLATAPLTFQAFPADGQEEGHEFGLWIEEQPGTIVAAS
jgi:hypothetical protein